MEPQQSLVLVAVGTTHPLNIAGVGLDARIAPLLGIRVVTVVAGVSAQSANSVLARFPVDEETIAAQFAALTDVPIGAVHIGALLDPQSVVAVARALAGLSGVPVVCDPVLAASGGDVLADVTTADVIRAEIFPRCTLVTPNIAEASALVARPISDVAGMEAAAHELLSGTDSAVLIKGGHLADEPTDVLATADGITHFAAPRIPVTLRGTGDLLACALAARLGYGDDLVAAINAARAFVRGCLAAGVPFAGARTVP